MHTQSDQSQAPLVHGFAVDLGVSHFTKEYWPLYLEIVFRDHSWSTFRCFSSRSCDVLSVTLYPGYVSSEVIVCSYETGNFIDIFLTSLSLQCDRPATELVNQTLDGCVSSVPISRMSKEKGVFSFSMVKYSDNLNTKVVIFLFLFPTIVVS